MKNAYKLRHKHTHTNENGNNQFFSEKKSWRWTCEPNEWTFVRTNGWMTEWVSEREDDQERANGIEMKSTRAKLHVASAMYVCIQNQRVEMISNYHSLNDSMAMANMHTMHTRILTTTTTTYGWRCFLYNVHSLYCTSLHILKTSFFLSYLLSLPPFCRFAVFTHRHIPCWSKSCALHPS